MRNITVLAIIGMLASIFDSTAALAKGAPKSTPQLISKGQAAYTANCAVCHGDKGDGNGPAGQALNPKPRDFTVGQFKAGGKPEQLFKTISEGLKGTAMASFSHLPEQDRWGLVYYVTSLKKK